MGFNWIFRHRAIILTKTYISIDRQQLSNVVIEVELMVRNIHYAVLLNLQLSKCHLCIEPLPPDFSQCGHLFISLTEPFKWDVLPFNVFVPPFGAPGLPLIFSGFSFFIPLFQGSFPYIGFFSPTFAAPILFLCVVDLGIPFPNPSSDFESLFLCSSVTT